MSDFTNQFAAPRARDIQHTRRAQIAPLLAMSVRAISAATGIPVGAKRQLEKSMAQKPGRRAGCFLVSYLVKRTSAACRSKFGGSRFLVYERAVESAIGRGLLGRGDVGDAWIVLSALFAGMCWG